MTRIRCFPLVILAFALAVLSGCAGRAVPGPGVRTIEGRVSDGGLGVGGAEVLLYTPRFYLEAGRSAAARAVSRADGTFELQAPPGAYLVVARRGDRFAYFGRNPVHLVAPLRGVHLPLVAGAPIRKLPVPKSKEALEGRVLAGGLPVEGARVFAYVDPSRGLRGPGYARSDPTGPDGTYRLPLPPGTYFAAARFRADGGQAGALEPGDLFGVLGEFPFTLAAGEAARGDLETVALPSREMMGRFRGGFAWVSGTTLDAGGRPVAGVRACLYGNRQLLDRPLAISEPTGGDGRFIIEGVPAGLYYLGARESLGAPPAPGERVGFYRGPRGAALELAPGARVEGLAVVIQVVP